MSLQMERKATPHTSKYDAFIFAHIGDQLLTYSSLFNKFSVLRQVTSFTNDKRLIK